MAFLGIQIPHDIARLLSQIDYGGYGKPEPKDTFHITIAYFGEDIPIEKIVGIIHSTYKITSKTKPFTAQTSLVTTFPPHPEEGTVPVICKVESPALHKLRKALVGQFDEDDVKYNQKFPNYTPHITLAYTSPGDGAEEVKNLNKTIPTIKWGCGEIVLWGGDNGDERLSVNFPFAWTPTKEAIYRNLVRVARFHQRVDKSITQ